MTEKEAKKFIQYLIKADVLRGGIREAVVTIFSGWLESFNTESATACFEAVQLLKAKVEEYEKGAKENYGD